MQCVPAACGALVLWRIADARARDRRCLLLNAVAAGARRRLPPPLPAHRPCRPPSRLCSLQSEYDAGAGTCVRDTFVCATLVGEKRVLPAAEGESEQVRHGPSLLAWLELQQVAAVLPQI